jgi:predicted outer membrane repeat protein
MAPDLTIAGPSDGSGNGGGAYIDSAVDVTLEGVSFVENSASSGGAVCSTSSPFVALNGTLTSNTATEFGAAVYLASGDLDVLFSTSLNNNVSASSAIDLFGNATFQGLQASGNSAGAGNVGAVANVIGNGGGICCETCTFASNLVAELSQGATVYDVPSASTTRSVQCAGGLCTEIAVSCP